MPDHQEPVPGIAGYSREILVPCGPRDREIDALECASDVHDLSVDIVIGSGCVPIILPDHQMPLKVIVGCIWVRLENRSGDEWEASAQEFSPI